ncbi:MAG: hypothetical protein SNJ55_13730 [Chloroherpetonaceae bacterium]
MRKLMALMLVGAISLSFAACGDSEDSSTNPTPQDPIVGTWLAEGTTTVGGVPVPNVSPLLFGSPFNIRRIRATFNANGTYTVTTTDSAGTNATLTGTWTTSAADTAGITIRNITVNQTSPSTVTSRGIYQVTTSGSVTTMLYEIAQTEPPLQGVTPPTPRGGFGSTSGGAFGIANIQRYTKQ